MTFQRLLCHGTFLSLCALTTACSKSHRGPLEAPPLGSPSPLLSAGQPSAEIPPELASPAPSVSTEAQGSPSSTLPASSSSASPSPVTPVPTPQAHFGFEVALYAKYATFEEITQQKVTPFQRLFLCEKPHLSAKEEGSEKPSILQNKIELFPESDTRTLQLSYSLTRTRKTIWVDGKDSPEFLYDLNLSLIRETHSSAGDMRDELASLEKSRIVQGGEAQLISHPDFWILMGYNTNLEKACANQQTELTE